MNKLLLIPLLTLMMVGCNSDQKDTLIDDYLPEALNLPVFQKEGSIFKTIYESDDTLITVFINKQNGLVIQSFFVDSLSVKTDTLQLDYTIKNQSYIQAINGNDLLIYTPQDSVKLALISPNQKVYYTATDFRLSNASKITFSDDTKLITDSKTSSNQFEYRLGTFTTDSDAPMTGAFDFEKKEVGVLGINYPERYQTNYYGFLNDIQEVYTDSLIIYNPVALPELWIYNRTTKSVEIKAVRSLYQVKNVETISEEEKKRSNIKTIIEKHQTVNGNYSRLVYNQYLNCYYRFYQHPQPLKTADGYFTTHQDRRVSCIHLDENFEFITEIVLPPSCFFIYIAIATKEGFIINRGSLFEDGLMRLLAVKL